MVLGLVVEEEVEEDLALLRRRDRGMEGLGRIRLIRMVSCAGEACEVGAWVS